MRVILSRSQIVDHMIQSADGYVCSTQIAFNAQASRTSGMNQISIVLCASRSIRVFGSMQRNFSAASM